MENKKTFKAENGKQRGKLFAILGLCAGFFVHTHCGRGHSARKRYGYNYRGYGFGGFMGYR